MSSELSSLNLAVPTDRPVGSGANAIRVPVGIPTPSNSVPTVGAQAGLQQANAVAVPTQQTVSNQQTNARINEQRLQENKKIQAAEQEQTQAAAETKEQDLDTLGSISASELREILDEINSALYSYNRSLRFELHEDTEDLVVKVFNTKTDEVIRQYPSEDVLARRAKLLAGDTDSFSAQVF